MLIDFSDYDMENTAKAVYAMNESAREYYDNWRELQEAIISFAYQFARTNTTSASTGGYQVTFTRDADGSRVYVTPSVSSYVASRYAEQVSDRLNTIRSLTD